MNNTVNNPEEKKNLFYVVLLILTLVTVIIGAAFAAYTFLHSQKEGSSNVYTGTLVIEYQEGTRIYINNIFPTSDPQVTDTENIYKNNFRIKNNGILDGILRLNIEITRNEFVEGSLKYKLFSSSGVELIAGDVPTEGNFEIINNVLIESKSTVEFILAIWLDETGEIQNDEMGKMLVGNIRADVSQKLD